MKVAKAILGYLVDASWLAFLMCGVALLILGSGAVKSSSFTFTPTGTITWVLLVAGCALLAFGCYLAMQINRQASRLSPTRYEVTFESPTASEGATSDRITVSGSLSRPLPAGYELWLMRSWESNSDGDRPVGRADFEDNRRKWRVVDAYIGGSPGDLITLQAWLAGQDGSLMLETWSEGKHRYARLMGSSGTAWTVATDYPGVRRRPRDTLASGRLEVRRR